MNIINKVTLRSLLLNKTRTAVTIIGIVLSAAMICAVTTSVSSLHGFAIKNEIYNAGSWHGSAKGLDDRAVAKIAADTKDIAIERAVGFADCDSFDKQNRPYYYIGAVNDRYFELMPVHLTEGRLPQNESEILLPDSLNIVGGVYHEIGDILDLSVGNTAKNGVYYGENMYNTLPVGQEDDTAIIDGKPQSYTVVGYYDSSTYIIHQVPGFTCFTLDNSIQQSKYNVWFTMDDPSDVYDYIEQNGIESGATNTALLAYFGVLAYGGFYSYIFGIAVIVILLIIFGSVSLIYNAFSISVSERTRQFGLLSSIGATRRQLRSSVLFEALAVSAVGIPIGVVCGIGGIAVTLMLVGEKISTVAGGSIPLTVSVSPLSVVVACALALITVLISAWVPSARGARVSAIEAIRESRDIKIKRKQVKTPRITLKLLGVPGMLAAKNYKRNRKKHRATVLSLFMSIVLFVSASSFTDYLVKAAGNSLQTNGYDIVWYCGSEDTDVEALYDTLDSCDGVEKTAFAYRLTSLLSTDTQNLTDDAKKLILTGSEDETEAGEMSPFFGYIYFVDDKNFERVIEENGLDLEYYTDFQNPRALIYDTTTLFDRQTEKYHTVDFLKEGERTAVFEYTQTIDGYHWFGSYKTESGEKIMQYRSDTDSTQYLDKPADEVTTTITLTSGDNLKNAPFFVDINSTADVSYIYPYSAKELILTDNITYFTGDGHEYIFKTSDWQTAENAIYKCLLSNGKTTVIENNAKEVESSRNIILIVRVFSYGFIVLISLIAVANVFNTISTNVALRRREFAMLKSVGMTSRGFNRMMNFECLLYGSHALGLGLPVSALVVFAIYKVTNISYVTGYRLPLTAMLISTVCVFLVVFVTMMYSMHKIKKDDPIDALKNENA